MNLQDFFENIDRQQQRVKQLPADFQPPKTSPQLSGPYPGRNATRGYLVGEGEQEPLAELAGDEMQYATTTAPTATDDPEKLFGVLIYGRFGRQDPWARTAWAALRRELPREYPSEQDAQVKVAEIAEHGGAIVTEKPKAEAERLVQRFQGYGLKSKIIDPRDLTEIAGEAEQAPQFYALVHKVTNTPLSTHRDEESARDAWRGLDQNQRPFFKVVTTRTPPRDWNMTSEATGDRQFDDMMRKIKKGTKKQATADRRERERQSREQARAAFGPSPADRLSIRPDKGVAEMDSQGYRGHRGDEDPGKGPEKSVKPTKAKAVAKDAEKELAKAMDREHAKEKQQGVAEEGYGTHPSQRVDPRTGKRYVPPKSPLGKGVAEGSKEKTPGIALSKAYKKDFDGKKPGHNKPETALTGAYSKTGKPGGELKKKGVSEAGYNPLDDERREQQAMDQERAQFKRDELAAELGGEEQRAQTIMSGTWYVIIDGQAWRRQGQPVTFRGRDTARRAGQTIKQRNPGKIVTITTRLPAAKVNEQDYLEAFRATVAEGVTSEDVLSSMKRRLGDYLQDVATAIRKDPDLIDKIPKTTDQIGPAVRTMRTDDGHEIRIHGNEDDGFRISIRGRNMESRFSSLEEAEIATEMYMARRRTRNADYIEEKHIYEAKKDACYNKVKSRYKVWPSAYASGALVQCRKKGAKNWGNKTQVDEGWRQTLAAMAAAGIMALSGGGAAQAAATDTNPNKITATIQIDGQTQIFDLSSKGRDVKEASRWLEQFLDSRGVEGWTASVERGVRGSGNYQRMNIDSQGGPIR